MIPELALSLKLSWEEKENLVVTISSERKIFHWNNVDRNMDILQANSEEINLKINKISSGKKLVVNRKFIPAPVPIVDEKGDIWVPHHNPNKPPRKRKPGQCPHARQKDRCKDCGGSAICIHGKQKRFCRACDGSAFCPHGRQKARCKECGGSSICPHGRQKNRCKECGGAGICVHRREKTSCKECKAAVMSTKSSCQGDDDKSIMSKCQQDKRKNQCQQLKMMTTSKQNDEMLKSESNNDQSAVTESLLELAMVASLEYESSAKLPSPTITTSTSTSMMENNGIMGNDQYQLPSSLPIKKRKLNYSDSNDDHIAHTGVKKMESTEDKHDRSNIALSGVIDNCKTDLVKYHGATSITNSDNDNGHTSNEDVDVGEDGGSERSFKSIN